MIVCLGVTAYFVAAFFAVIVEWFSNAFMVMHYFLVNLCIAISHMRLDFLKYSSGIDT